MPSRAVHGHAHIACLDCLFVRGADNELSRLSAAVVSAAAAVLTGDVGAHIVSQKGQYLQEDVTSCVVMSAQAQPSLRCLPWPRPSSGSGDTLLRS